MVEQVLGEVVQSIRVFTVLEAEKRSHAKTESVAKSIVQSVRSITGSIFLIAEIVGELVDKAVGKNRLCDIEAASTTSASTDAFTQQAFPCPISALKMPPRSESHEELHRNGRHRLSLKSPQLPLEIGIQWALFDSKFRVWQVFQAREPGQPPIDRHKLPKKLPLVERVANRH